MLNSNNQEAAMGLFDLAPNLVLFNPEKFHVDYYMVVKRSTRADLILNYPPVVRSLNLLEGNLLPKAGPFFQKLYC